MRNGKAKAAATLAATVTGLALAVATGGTPAGASGYGQLRVGHVIADNYVGPLQFDVSWKGIYVADGFTSTLNKVGRDAPIATGGDPSTGGDVGGVVVNPRTGDIAYTTSNGDHSQTYLIVLRHGKRILKANLARYENNHNPDKHIVYGAYKPSDCARQALENAGVPVRYKGLKDSHPYAVASLRDGSYAVADAGGNDILRVKKNGSISTLAVLPPRLWRVPASFVEEQGLPSCVTGTRYFVEGVPTDVETGPYGGLYVSSLPGLDAQGLGAVYRLDHHRLCLIGSGFDQATNLAVTRAGRVYVAELGKGRISVLHHGRPHPVLDLPGVVGVEAVGNHLFASVAPALIGQQAPGSIVALTHAHPSS